MSRRKLGRGFSTAAVYGLAISLALFSLFPMLWAASSSIKNRQEVYSVNPVWITAHPTAGNYLQVFRNPRMMRYLLNTVIISVGSTAIAMVFGLLGAFGFSRMRFIGKESTFSAIFLSRMLPQAVLVIPLYLLAKRLAIDNSYQGLILVYLALVVPLTVWLLRGYLGAIPIDLDEAARIDGCSRLQVLWHVILPLVMPGLVAVAVYAFVIAWNEFFFALVLTEQDMRTISVGLAYYTEDQQVDWGGLMAAGMVMSVPAVLLFLLIERRLVAGLTQGSIKG